MNWIKVEDQLPELEKYVLCVMKSMFTGVPMMVLKPYIYGINTNYEKMMFSSIDKSWRIEDITHWMPLPEKPE